MSERKFGKYHGDDPSSTQERILERFSNLRKRLVGSSLCRSFIIEERGTSVKVPVPRVRKDVVLNIPADPSTDNSLVLEDAFGHTPEGKTVACPHHPENKPVSPCSLRCQRERIKPCISGQTVNNSTIHRKDFKAPFEYSELANLSSSLPMPTSSPIQDRCAPSCGPIIVELNSDILDFSSGALFNDGAVNVAKDKNLDSLASERRASSAEINNKNRTRPAKAAFPDGLASRGVFSSGQRSIDLLEAELKALDGHYMIERRRICSKYGHAFDQHAPSAAHLRSSSATQGQKRRKYGEQLQIEKGIQNAQPDSLEHRLQDCTLISSLATFTPEELKYALDLRSIHFKSLDVRPVKIAEASFSEVFRVGSHIYKIMPFNENYQDEAFFREVAAMIAMRHEYGVVKLIDAFILRGAYAQVFLDAWNAFSEPENPDPACYGPDQRYGCIVMEDGGRDLESYVFRTAREIVSFLAELSRIIYNLQIKFLFEHRDLHWGNILIRETGVAIIDYSLSRLEFALDDITEHRSRHAIANASHTSPAATRRAKTIYTDLEKEEWLFTGDDAVDEQFRIYKEMRANSNGNWLAFNPQSNGLWIGYVIGKLMMKGSAISNLAERRKALKLLRQIYDYFSLQGWGANLVYFVEDILSNSFRTRRRTTHGKIAK